MSWLDIQAMSFSEYFHKQFPELCGKFDSLLWIHFFVFVLLIECCIYSEFLCKMCKCSIVTFGYNFDP